MVEWIAVDWGTSNLRIWAMDANAQVLAEKRSDQGMGGLAPEAFEGVLLSHIEEWLGDGTIPVIACGMVGSRQGWQEAPYVAIPTPPIQNSIKVTTSDPRIDLRILSGIKQNNPADVMRGEETQIAGFLTEFPQYEGGVCLPGTHSKWVEIRDGKILKFQTALTGELFALLSERSVLRHSLGEWNDAAFISRLKTTIQFPQNAFSSLFSIRAQGLLEGNNHGIAQISATLIGCELSGTSNYWRDQPIAIIGVGELARLYMLALKTLGQEAQDYRASDLTLSGLRTAYQEVIK